MKSVKLTNSIREGIIKQLMKLPREKFENRLKELGKLCDSILIKSINKEILEIDKKQTKNIQNLLIKEIIFHLTVFQLMKEYINLFPQANGIIVMMMKILNFFERMRRFKIFVNN